MRDRSAPLTKSDIPSLDWIKMDGHLPAIVQDCATGELLMLGYMNREALAATLETGFATFFSRSKGRLWKKGETSGNILRVLAVHEDCDGDALRVDLVRQHMERVQAQPERLEVLEHDATVAVNKPLRFPGGA